MFGLNKLADRDFVIGFVLPVLIAFAGFGWLFSDQLPAAATIASMANEKSFAGLTVVILVVWTSATVLMALNRTLYRLLEGYFGILKKEEWREALKEQRKATEDVNNGLWDAAFAPDGQAIPGRLNDQSKYAAAQAEFVGAFPKEDLVMPTRFGNVVRAFENYPTDVYGLDGISGWMRLVGVLPPNYIAIVNDARAEVDFWVNCCCLAAAFAAAAAGRVAYDLLEFLACGTKFEMAEVYRGAAVFGALYLSNLAYQCAVERAKDWGGAVKAAFDLYLPALAKQLGYELPKARTPPNGRDDFWDAVSAMFVLHVPMKPELWVQVPPTAGDKDADNKEKPEDEDRGKEDDGDEDRGEREQAPERAATGGTEAAGSTDDAGAGGAGTHVATPAKGASTAESARGRDDGEGP